MTAGSGSSRPSLRKITPRSWQKHENKMHDVTRSELGRKHSSIAGRRRRNSIASAFASHRIEMLDSPAWRVLSLSGHRVLSRVAIELARHGGHIGDGLPVTYADFQGYGIERHAIAPAIREVEALGFLRITQKGRAGNAEFRRATLYRPTYLQSVDSQPTDECDASAPPPRQREKPKKPEECSSRAETEFQCGKPHRHQCGKSAPKMTISKCGKPHHYGGENPHHYLYLGGMGVVTSPIQHHRTAQQDINNVRFTPKRWGNRLAFLWIAEDFGCCASG
jgi:hypothetical protein